MAESKGKSHQSYSASIGKKAEFGGQEQQNDIRRSNIHAGKSVADTVRTSLGPKGCDKMITTGSGEVIISNDGATILQKIEVIHPAAKMVTDISKAQDIEAGDGTTSVVVLCGEILSAAQDLLDKGIHPTTISDAFLQSGKAAAEILKNEVALPVDLSNRNSLIDAAITSLSSKVVSSNSAVLAPLAVDAVLQVIDPKTATNVDLTQIRVVKKLGGTIDDTELIDGLVFENSASHVAGGPTRVADAKVALIQYQLSAPKTNMDNQIVIDDYQQIDRVLKEERKYILKLVKPIVKSGCNVLLIQKSILRDATNDLSLHYLAKKGIMVVTDVERTDVDFICNTLGCTPIADPEGFTAEKLGDADLAQEVHTSSGNLVKITGVKNPGKTVSVLVRASNRLALDEAHRSLHDSLCVIRSLVKCRYLVAGGGAPEAELSLRLGEHADRIGGVVGYCMRAYARALEVIPYTLAENGGLHPISIVTELRRQHAEGKKTAGINVKAGKITDMAAEKVLQPLLVSLSALSLATECARMILKIDGIVTVR